MNNLVIDHTITKTEEGTYYTIPFAVPEGIEKITVSYSYQRMSGKVGHPEKMVNVVDLGLMNESGKFLGWSGSSRSSVFVGPYSATNGYLMSEVKAGEWKILVGAYKIPPAGLPVRYEITFTPSQPRWLLGDLHMHSTASDGQYDVSTLARMAQKKGLDFIALTNHNNYSENLHLPLIPGLTIIPGVEWTHYRGHMNFFGVANPFDNSFVANSDEEMLTIIRNAKQRGALISVNHPKCNLCPYLWRNTDCFDLVEVWNGPMRKVNRDGIVWWHEMQVNGQRKPLVGGSDFHRSLHPVRMGNPVTHVYSSTPAVSDLLSAIAQGHSYVSSSVNGVQLNLTCGDSLMGDLVEQTESQVLSISAKNLQPGMSVKLITQTGAAAEWHKFAAGSLTAEVPISPAWRFAYLLVTRQIFRTDIVRAISNPIYFR